MENQLRTFEDNQRRYYGMVEQPLIIALRSSHPETAIQLLERGADPNVVTSSSQNYMQAWYYSRFTGESALDLAENHLAALRRYEGETQTSSAPSLPEGMDIYLKKFEEGTYQHWVVSEEINRRRASYREDLKRYEQQKTASGSPPGVKEKEVAIAGALETMEKVREALLAKGAKTFADLHPEFKDRLETPSNNRWNYSTFHHTNTGPFKYTFSFQNVNDVTETRKAAYLKL
jgi:hypothetical protein